MEMVNKSLTLSTKPVDNVVSKMLVVLVKDLQVRCGTKVLKV